MKSYFHHWRKDLPGLAHFLEHMLFTGTAKYPKEGVVRPGDATVGWTKLVRMPGEYHEFMQQNGGESNAYTACYFTCYMHGAPGQQDSMNGRPNSDGFFWWSNGDVVQWFGVKTLVPCREPQVIAGIYGCSSHYSNVSIGIDPYPFWKGDSEKSPILPRFEVKPEVMGEAERARRWRIHELVVLVGFQPQLCGNLQNPKKMEIYHLGGTIYWWTIYIYIYLLFILF